MRLRVDCPDWDEAIRACYCEDRLIEAHTPAQLYAAMKRVEPTVPEIIQKSRDG